MIEQFQDYLTFKNIYLYTNLIVIPFWLMIILIPNSKITKIIVNSIFLPLMFSSAYIFIIYKMIILDESLIQIFQLYLDLDNLYTLFSTEGFLLVFWLHFLSINLFLGSWMSSDGIKYNMPRSLVAVSLIFVYFMGPVGLVLHWFLRIFYAKKINLYD